MSKTKKVISVVLAAALIMAMAAVAMVSASAATTIYFEKPESWDAAHAYIWDATTNNGWAGVLMTDCGDGLWSIEAEPGANIIFTNGKGGAGFQTADNVVPMDGSNCAYLNGETATNGYGEVFDAIGWKTVGANDDVTTTAAPVVTTTAAPVETTAAPVETTVAEPVETTAAPVETTVAEPVETTAAPVETTVAEPVETTAAPVETTVAEPVETTAAPVETTAVVEPVETTAAPVETTVAVVEGGIIVDGADYTAEAGAEITYVANLKTPNKIEDVQGYVTYDATKLTIVEATTPNILGAIINTGEAGVVYFNATEVNNGMDFTTEAALIQIKFTVVDGTNTEIALTIEEMTERNGGSYFTDSEKVNADVTVAETLAVPEETQPTTTVVVEPTTTVVVEPTDATTVVVDPTKAPETNVTGGTDAPTENPDVPVTGSTVAIYAVLATLAMAAAAVVVLRKKVNG